MIGLALLAVLPLDPLGGYYVTDSSSFVEAETISMSGDVASFTMVVVLSRQNPVAFEGAVEINCKAKMIRWIRAREIGRDNASGPFLEWSDAAWQPLSETMYQVRRVVCENDQDALPHRLVSRADIISEAQRPKPTLPGLSRSE